MILSNDEKSIISRIFFENIVINVKQCDFSMLGVKIGTNVCEVYCDGDRVK